MNRCQAFSTFLAFFLITCSAAAPPASPKVSLAPAAGSPLPIEAYAIAIADERGFSRTDRHRPASADFPWRRQRAILAARLRSDLKGYFTGVAIADVNADFDVTPPSTIQYSVLVSGRWEGKFATAPASLLAQATSPRTHSLLVCDVNQQTRHHHLAPTAISP
jgi:hypothetical protein